MKGNFIFGKERLKKYGSENFKDCSVHVCMIMSNETVSMLSKDNRNDIVRHEKELFSDMSGSFSSLLPPDKYDKHSNPRPLLTPHSLFLITLYPHNTFPTPQDSLTDQRSPSIKSQRDAIFPNE